MIEFLDQLTNILYRVHEQNDNPNMRFMVRIKINNVEVTRGIGRNKKAAKYAAS